MLIIGLTGTKAGGKGEIANYLKEKGFVYFSLSNIVREEAARRGLKNYTIKDLQDIGNDLRQKHGLGVLAEMAIKKIEQEKKRKKEKFVIDGIRNPGEIIAFCKLKNFYLIAADAPQEQRFKWLVARSRESDPKTWLEFLKMDARDQGNEEQKVGQQVKACMKMADFHIENDSTIGALHKKVDIILKTIEK